VKNWHSKRKEKAKKPRRQGKKKKERPTMVPCYLLRRGHANKVAGRGGGRKGNSRPGVRQGGRGREKERYVAQLIIEKEKKKENLGALSYF